MKKFFYFVLIFLMFFYIVTFIFAIKSIIKDTNNVCDDKIITYNKPNNNYIEPERADLEERFAFTNIVLYKNDYPGINYELEKYCYRCNNCGKIFLFTYMGIDNYSYCLQANYFTNYDGSKVYNGEIMKCHICQRLFNVDYVFSHPYIIEWK